MTHTAAWWLSLNFLSIVMLAFYSMLEMACVSFNKVRLQYYVSRGIKQAIWLNYLLQNPSRLFGTTLIAVNIALVVGSECAREFHSSIGLNPDLAPLSQVILVVIFGELAPMFAARHYPEHVAMLGVPVVYATAKVMTPFLWILGGFSKICDFCLGDKKSESKIFLSREELLKLLESQEEEKPSGSDTDEFNNVVTNIFLLRDKDVRQVMTPLVQIPMIPSNGTVMQARLALQKSKHDYLPIFQKDKNNIVAIVQPRDLIRAPDAKRARDYSQSPWFITQITSLTQILKQFRTNNKNVAVVLDAKGKAIGMINLDDIIEEIFGEPRLYKPAQQNLLIVERTFSTSTKIADLNKELGIELQFSSQATLNDLIHDKLGEHPKVGESFVIGAFEIIIKSISLLETKTVTIRSILK
jgi:putative hemolysin